MVTLTLSGKGIERLDGEGGLHRVQRVPLNEKRGRVHTSDVSVVVLDPAHTVTAHPSLRREKTDFSLEWYSGSGAGGQHRNKHQNCARLTHLPTGLVKTAQHRSRQQSEMAARLAMDTDLDALLEGARTGLVNTQRRDQQTQEIARKRLWSFQRDQVLDENGRMMTCKAAMKGGMDALWD
jgi:peptide chain release factor 1